MSRKALLAAAKRERAGAIGILECCTCPYPLELAKTSTEHEESCQAHSMLISRDNAKALEAARARGAG
jgi:hypothetical protein